MPKRVEIKTATEAHAGRCAFCGTDYVLTHHVVLWGSWMVPACRTCGLALDRLVRWEAEARSRYHQNRAERREKALFQPS